MNKESKMINEGLEMARCAQANLINLGALLPLFKDQILFKIVELQIQQTIDALDPKPPEIQG
jgi:hypothetical protein